MNNMQLMIEIRKLKDQYESCRFLAAFYSRQGDKFSKIMFRNKMAHIDRRIQELTLLLNTEKASSGQSDPGE